MVVGEEATIPLETKSIMLVGAGIGLEDKERGIAFASRLGGKEVTLNE